MDSDDEWLANGCPTDDDAPSCDEDSSTESDSDSGSDDTTSVRSRRVAAAHAFDKP
jgi:hypothetical protein